MNFSLSTCTHKRTHIYVQRASSQRVNKVHFGIRHPWFLKPQAVIPLPFAVAPLQISLAEPPSHSLVARPFLPLPPTAPALSSASRIAFATFTLTLHLSLSLSSSLSLTITVLFRLCFSFPRAAPACLPVFLYSSSGPRRSLPSAVALARWYSTDPAASFPLSSPTSVPRIRTPLQKTQVQCGRNGGFLPSFPFTLFPSFLLYLSLNLFPSRLLSPPTVPVSFFYPRPFSSVSLAIPSFHSSESVALSRFIVHLKVASRSHQALVILNHRSNADDSVTMRFSQNWKSHLLCSDRNKFFSNFFRMFFCTKRQQQRILIMLNIFLLVASLFIVFVFYFSFTSLLFGHCI